MFMMERLNINDTFIILLHDNIIDLFKQSILISIVSKVHQIPYSLL